MRSQVASGVIRQMTAVEGPMQDPALAYVLINETEVILRDSQAIDVQ